MFYNFVKKIPQLDPSQLQGQMNLTFLNVRAYYIANMDYVQQPLSKLFKFDIEPDYIGYNELDGKTDIYTDTEHTNLVWFLPEYHGLITFYNIVNFKPRLHTLTTALGDTSDVGFFNKEDVQYHSHFKFTPNSLWLYDASIPHKVLPTGSSTTLKYIKFGWHASFNDVLSSIQEL